MAKFDSDFAIFGTLAGDIHQGRPVARTVIDYTNRACQNLYGELRGKTIAELFRMISNDASEVEKRLTSFLEQGKIEFEGKLAGKFIKFHSRILDCRDDSTCPPSRYVQAGIADITESTVLKKLLYGTSEALHRAAEAADDDTGQHITRINEYAKTLATLMGADKKFIEDISRFAQLHDIGKIKIANLIRTPRKLTPAEILEIKRHPEYGAAMVAGLDGLEMAYDISLDHHERWDGTGYPAGKIGEEISLAGRIVAIVDVFDALVSERPYKEAYSYADTRLRLMEGDERVQPSYFDPHLLQIFLENYADFVAIHKRMAG